MFRATSLFASALVLASAGLASPADARDTHPACDLFMGDVNGSDTVDIDDFHDLWDYFFNGNLDIFLEVADVNGSGSLDGAADSIYLLAYVNYNGSPPVTDLVSGDANGDGSFDYADFVSLAHYLNGSSDTICRTGADANRDSVLDIADLVVIGENL